MTKHLFPSLHGNNDLDADSRLQEGGSLKESKARFNSTHESSISSCTLRKDPTQSQELQDQARRWLTVVALWAQMEINMKASDFIANIAFCILKTMP